MKKKENDHLSCDTVDIQSIDDDFLETYVMMCQTISKPVRLRVLFLIGKGKMNVTTIQQELDIPLSGLSNHLKELYRAGVLGREKQGNFVYYFLKDPELLEGLNNMNKIVKSLIDKRNI